MNRSIVIDRIEAAFKSESWWRTANSNELVDVGQNTFVHVVQNAVVVGHQMPGSGWCLQFCYFSCNWKRQEVSTQSWTCQRHNSNKKPKGLWHFLTDGRRLDRSTGHAGSWVALIKSIDSASTRGKVKGYDTHNFKSLNEDCLARCSTIFDDNDNTWHNSLSKFRYWDFIQLF